MPTVTTTRHRIGSLVTRFHPTALHLTAQGDRVPRFRTRSRSRSSALALIAVSAIALAGCASGGGASTDTNTETTTISFQLDWVKDSGFAGMFVADADGYYAEEGLDVEFLDGGDVASTAAVIAGGGADIGIVSNMARLIDAIQTGTELVAVGALYQQSPAGLMTLPEVEVTDVSDLAGLRVGTDEAGSADIDTLFLVNGMEPDWEDVRVGYDAAPLFAGQIDAYYAYVTNQPIPYELDGVDVNTVTFAQLGFESYAGLIVTTREYLDSHRDEVVGFVRATQRGWESAIDDTANAAQITMNDYGMDLGLDEATQVASLDAMVELMQSDLTASDGLLAMDMAAITGAQYDALLASGRTDLPDAADVFDTTVVADAAG